MSGLTLCSEIIIPNLHASLSLHKSSNILPKQEIRADYYGNLQKTVIGTHMKNAPSHHRKKRYNRDILLNLIIQPLLLQQELQP